MFLSTIARRSRRQFSRFSVRIASISPRDERVPPASLSAKARTSAAASRPSQNEAATSAIGVPEASAW